MRPVATKQPLSANITQTSESCASEWVKIYFYTQRAQLNLAEGKDVKLVLIFFTVSAAHVRALAQI